MNFIKIIVLTAILLVPQFLLFAQKGDGNADTNRKNIPIDNRIHLNNKSSVNDFNSNYTKTNLKSENLFATVKQGGPLMIFILLLGLAGLTIVIERTIYYIKNSTWKKKTLEEYLIKAADRSESKYREQLDDELRDAFQLYVNRAEKGMALLNGIGNVAPIVGFLGTVIGMISAFAAIAAATTVNAKVVAVGIQIALVTTAGGLIIAAPLLASFHLFNHIIQNIYKYADEIIFEKVSSLPSFLDHKENSEIKSVYGS